jgi:hypothetical protein
VGGRWPRRRRQSRGERCRRCLSTIHSRAQCRDRPSFLPSFLPSFFPSFFPSARCHLGCSHPGSPCSHRLTHGPIYLIHHLKVSTDGVVYGWGGLQGSTLASLNSTTGEQLWSWKSNTSGAVFGDITTAGAVDEGLNMVFVGTSSSHTFAGTITTASFATSPNAQPPYCLPTTAKV